MTKIGCGSCGKTIAIVDEKGRPVIRCHRCGFDTVLELFVQTETPVPDFRSAGTIEPIFTKNIINK
jgi:DNA-directed RNA polymerase subunit RPC12/RpoP